MMDSKTSENDSLAEKLEILQNEVRWIRRIGVAAAVFVVVFLLIYRHHRYRSVTAQEFVLEDSLGRERAKLAFLPNGAGLQIFAASGEPRVELVGGGEEAKLDLLVPVTAESTHASINLLQDRAVMATFRADGFDLHPAEGSGAATLSLRRGTASLSLVGAGEGAAQVSLETDANRACAASNASPEPSPKNAPCLHSPGLPAIELIDLAGNRTTLGVTPAAGSAADSSKQQNSSRH